MDYKNVKVMEKKQSKTKAFEGDQSEQSDFLTREKMHQVRGTQ